MDSHVFTTSTVRIALVAFRRGDQAAIVLPDPSPFASITIMTCVLRGSHDLPSVLLLFVNDLSMVECTSRNIASADPLRTVRLYVSAMTAISGPLNCPRDIS